jgi:uncharacterized protein YvpB
MVRSFGEGGRSTRGRGTLGHFVIRLSTTLVMTVLATLTVAACGSATAGAQPPARPSAPAASPQALPTPESAPTATPPPATPPATAPPATAPPAPPSPPPVTASFSGTISLSPAARVRFGPGMDMPVLDLAPAGRSELFDAWYRRADDPPQTDAITGKLEWWSRDWFRLADDRGWVHSAAVQGFPPAGLAQLEWQRPAALPAPAAELLAVGLDRQDQAASCEVAALKMALAYRGIPSTEAQLLELVGVDARPPQEDERGNLVRWGNPNLTFVGSPSGRQAEHTGYGVYAAPIAKVAAEVGARVGRAGTGIPAGDVYAAVLAGHPAVAWVTSDYRRGSVRTWTSWDGAAIPYSLNEHAVTVVGVTPGAVVINDPWWGQIWKSKADFEAAYSTFAQMAVIL